MEFINKEICTDINFLESFQKIPELLYFRQSTTQPKSLEILGGKLNRGKFPCKTEYTSQGCPLLRKFSVENIAPFVIDYLLSSLVT